MSTPKATAPPSAGRILSQVEFYMSDRNLLRDNFFREELAKDDGSARASSCHLFTIPLQEFMRN